MNKNLLIVDDDFISRYVLKQTMARHGFKIYEAKDGQEAIDLIGKNDSIVMVSLDLNMPVMDGYTFLNTINKSGLGDRLKIFITSCTSESDFLHTANLIDLKLDNVVKYFEKPFDMGSFAICVLDECV
jgi:two-component system response regulator (stage 0 sporulation protein F)